MQIKLTTNLPVSLAVAVEYPVLHEVRLLIHIFGSRFQDGRFCSLFPTRNHLDWAPALIPSSCLIGHLACTPWSGLLSTPVQAISAPAVCTKIPKMGTELFSEMLMYTVKATWQNNQEGHNLNSHCCENLKPYTEFYFSWYWIVIYLRRH
jgi:hypothetical protein